MSGYADGGDAPDKQLELVPGAVRDAEAFLTEQASTRARFDRVGELVEGFETPFGLELLATVHWVATREKATDARGCGRRRSMPGTIARSASRRARSASPSKPFARRVAGGGMKTDTSEKGLEALIVADMTGPRGGADPGGGFSERPRTLRRPAQLAARRSEGL